MTDDLSVCEILLSGSFPAAVFPTMQRSIRNQQALSIRRVSSDHAAKSG